MPYAKFGGTNKEYYGIFQSGLQLLPQQNTISDNKYFIEYKNRNENNEKYFYIKCNN